MSVLNQSPAMNLGVSPAVGTLLTADEFMVRYENQRAELVSGVVKELAMPDIDRGHFCGLITYYLTHFVIQHDLGRVMSNDSFIRIRNNPDTVLGPDVCFISFAKLPRGPLARGLLDAVPELVVEVRSPSETWTDVIAKVLDYLSAGVGAVVVVNPERQAVAVYRTNADEEQFSVTQELTIADVLPGFTLPVRKLFA
jgi:Uma2 family endonuclease